MSGARMTDKERVLREWRNAGAYRHGRCWIVSSAFKSPRDIFRIVYLGCGFRRDEAWADAVKRLPAARKIQRRTAAEAVKGEK